MSNIRSCMLKLSVLLVRTVFLNGSSAQDYHNLSSFRQRLWERLHAGPHAILLTDKILFAILILLSLELLNYIVKHSGEWLHAPRIPVRGKHLDDFSTKEKWFIAISKLQTAPFVYLYLRTGYYEGVSWSWSSTDLTLMNCIVPLVPLFVVYDFFYTILHWFLHVQCLYRYIHKHHHVQKAPSRANVDAINVHPIEYFLGEYNHLLALMVVHRYMVSIHVVGSMIFLALGGALAGLNHTRFDVHWKVCGITLFDSKAHDMHHRMPHSNFGQYIMLWDVVFGTFRPYNANDRVNAESQLDPQTGKSYSYMKDRRVAMIG